MLLFSCVEFFVIFAILKNMKMRKYKHYFIHKKDRFKLVLLTLVIIAILFSAIVVNTTRISKNSKAKTIQSEIESNDNYIYGGSKATVGEFPYMVGIIDNHKNSSGTNIDRLFCGGVVLNEHWIATAYHCKSIYEAMFQNDKNNDRDFINDAKVLILGDNSIDINSPAQATKIDKVYEWCFGVDQLLVKVKDKITIKKYVTLADKSLYIKGDPFDIIGFGVTTQNGSMSNQLLKAVSKITEPGTFFFQGKGDHGESICKGDSGSPALKRVGSVDYYIGIATDTLNCGNTTNYFSKVSQIKSCIENKIKE